ncbi:ABC transporter ATP-binding protein [Terrihabitans sp. B22-R8]|uniref:ABC transporter ATP-binding protein n=1 Tax=Terrihabitans sp. B22-R8 TaxID=3425128 RepID=UPI00403C1F1E
MSLVRLSRISKRFANGVHALEGFDLNVEAGEFLSLIGPSGCGKSTALRLLAGLDQPNSGEIARTGSRPGIGYVFQEPTLMQWASAFSNVWLPLRLKGISRREAAPAVEAALDLVGLRDFSRARPRELSGGMKMRVSIARALVTRPGLLLMDEPFAALDEITRFRLNDELLAIRRELGCTIVFVTHSVFEAVYLSDRVAVMSARPGRVTVDLPIPGPAQRTDAFRTSLPFAEAAQEISAALRGSYASDGLDKASAGVHS